VISSLIDDAISSVPTSTGPPRSLIPIGGQDAEDAPTVDHVRPVTDRQASLSRAPPQSALRQPVSPAVAPAPVSMTWDTKQLHALEVDALPEQYIVGRGKLPRWVWRVGLAVVCVVAGVLIGLLLLDDDTAPATASMEVVSIPEGAKVTINGELHPGTTPIVVQNVQPGTQYRIAVQLDGYRDWERREDIPLEGGPVKVIASLKPVLVTLHVESTPPEAEVFLNGRSVGRTPLTLTRLEPSSARIIELRAPGYAPERRTLDWSEQTEQRQQFTLKK
jgi:hypothetical protein